jgi:polyphosphate kinase 2
MKKSKYKKHLAKLQIELAHLQESVQQTGQKIVVLFEGRDAAGKGGAIKTITAKLNPRVVRIVALTKPTERETTQWYFQRYVAHLPAAGEIVLFDRSWYNRAGVESTCPAFEDTLIKSGITLIKYWFSVSDEEQETRFNKRLINPKKRWKFSVMDLASRSKWVEYSQAKDAMFEHTDTEKSPWFVVDADDKKAARLNCIDHLLSQIDYHPVKHDQITLPEINRKNYQRPPHQHQRHIPQKFD